MRLTHWGNHVTPAQVAFETYKRLFNSSLPAWENVPDDERVKWLELFAEVFHSGIEHMSAGFMRTDAEAK